MKYTLLFRNPHKTFMAAVLSLLALGTSSIADAQIPRWPSQPAGIMARPIIASGAAQPDWINTDMYDLNTAMGSNTVHAVVYDDPTASTPTVTLWVRNNFLGTTFTTTILDARHADVVIGDDSTNPYRDLKIGVVYEDLSTNTVKLQIYDLVNVWGGGTPALTATGGNPRLSGASGTPTPSPHSAKNPHIDMAPDPNAIPGGVPDPLRKYVATWSELNPTSGNWEVTASSTSINSTTAGARRYIDDGDMPDVAMVYNQATTNYEADFIYYNASAMAVREADWIVGTTTVNLYPVLDIGMVNQPPRIDAVNIAPTAVLHKSRKAVASIQPPGAPFPEIHTYEANGPMPNMMMVDYSNMVFTNPPSPQPNPLNTVGGYSPAVVIAVGPNVAANATDVGNRGYTMGWYIDGIELSAIYSDLINVNAVLAGYSQVDNPGCVTCNPDYLGADKNLLAFGSCSNTGFDLASVWWDAGFIWHKYSGNAFAFKPSEVSTIATKGGWRISPNPATSNVNISGQQGTAYSISDISGRILAHGTMAAPSENVDISHLPQGMYLLQLKAGTEAETVKFVKQ